MICSTLQTKRAERLQRQMVQTEFLLDAAIDRARHQLTRSAEYTGEVWRPEAALPGFDDVQVDIDVSKPNEESDSKLVKVVAKLATGVDYPMATQRSHTFEFISATPNEE